MYAKRNKEPTSKEPCMLREWAGQAITRVRLALARATAPLAIARSLARDHGAGGIRRKSRSETAWPFCISTFDDPFSTACESTL